MKQLYPAKIRFDRTDNAYPNGVYLVEFPDIEICHTFGTTLIEAYENGEDVLNLMIYGLIKSNQEVPKPSQLQEVDCEEDEFVTLIKVDTRQYVRRNRKKLKKYR